MDSTEAPDVNRHSLRPCIATTGFHSFWAMTRFRPWPQRDVAILSATVAMCFVLKEVMEGSESPVFTWRDLVNVVGADAANFLANQSFLAPKQVDFGMSTNVKATAAPDTPPLRVAFFFTTALSKQHQQFFPCWAFASQHVKLVQIGDAVLYSPKNLSQEHLAYFRNMRSVTVRLGKGGGYQAGAIQATKDGFGIRGAEEKWFAEHDWVIRLNPDVLIMDGDWLLETMLNTSIDGIFQDCGDCRFHSDFFAVRTKAVNSTLVETAPTRGAEAHVTAGFANIARSKRGLATNRPYLVAV